LRNCPTLVSRVGPLTDRISLGRGP
jgi:hypothetical protein